MVSVIIPCFNSEKFIDISIRSVYEQDYSYIELIVVDDGSTDNSKERILAWEERFEQKGYSFRYIYQDNRGLGGAIDTGLKYVNGKYLSLLDADDYLLQGSIAKRAAFLDEHEDYAGVRTNGWMLKGTDKIPFTSSPNEKSNTDYFNALFFDGAPNWAGSYMVRTDLLFDFYPDRSIYPSRSGQNMQIILPVAYKRKFGMIDEPLMVYVLHENSLSQVGASEVKNAKDDKNFYGYLDIYQHMVDIIITDKEEKKLYLSCLNSWRFRHECEKALETKDKKKLKANFRQLISTGQDTLADRIKVYSYLNPLMSSYYRIKRRFSVTKD